MTTRLQLFIRHGVSAFMGRSLTFRWALVIGMGAALTAVTIAVFCSTDQGSPSQQPQVHHRTREVGVVHRVLKVAHELDDAIGYLRGRRHIGLR